MSNQNVHINSNKISILVSAKKGTFNSKKVILERAASISIDPQETILADFDALVTSYQLGRVGDNYIVTEQGKQTIATYETFAKTLIQEIIRTRYV